ncbi:hypothetical protein E2C01_036273 [Portunus trituberculatus]|uniref:Uncharacterized protein n=1 Tax=Portunus trituberculatus TaxID=210409 RepID=A0A5B7FAW8_PORTR|nr:hypothetical protein [Portunus trituberculatus]
MTPDDPQETRTKGTAAATQIHPVPRPCIAKPAIHTQATRQENHLHVAASTLPHADRHKGATETSQ